MTLRPCAHPECSDGAGDRRITDRGLCDDCFPRLQRLLESLGRDFARLTALPVPRRAPGGRPDYGSATYGHPAEWASDAMTRIADSLWGWWDNLADDQRAARPSGRMRQRAKVKGALASLAAGAEQIARSAWCEDAVAEWLDLHREVDRALGHSKPREWLDPAPCWGCGATGLYLDRERSVVRCPTCGWSLPEQHWGLYGRSLRENREHHALAHRHETGGGCG